MGLDLSIEDEESVQNAEHMEDSWMTGIRLAEQIKV